MNILITLIEDLQILVEINSGDILIIYSDGITEAFNEREEEFGEERLLAVLKNNLKSTAEVLVENVFEAVNIFVNDGKQSDDITLVAIKKI